ncbi:uncharacterized protein LOC116952910 [Petromyzon marinus]|uniref:Uncharacterized protein LOC116952910 isoform X1 n=1 Tax=Petromyzon marinus TaxID=7757 RepID=A0AAJ7U2I2_PETMA|nr:uncharacterized protein LOC116952910 isoform X1 [Petromyzon marinus]
MEAEDYQVEGTAQFAPVGENMHSADLLPSDYIPFFSDQPEDNNGDQNMNDVSAVPDAAAPAATEGTQSGAKRRKKKKKKKKPNAAPADGAPSAPAIGKPSSTAIAAQTPATSAGAPKAAVGTQGKAAAGVPLAPVVAVAVAAAAAGAQTQGAAATSGPTLTKNKKRKIKKKLRLKLLKASGVQVPPSPAELRKRKLKKKRRKERLKNMAAAAQVETQPSDVPMEESSKDLDKDELQVDQVTKEDLLGAGGDSVVLAAEPADGLAERQQPVAAGLARGCAAALELQRPGEGATDLAGR